ncbi:E3 SUMO-protein ligase PIAS2-like isoform X1 [Clavelina lepadiformis]|uniref:E3 SUMO-protein ligase PIAS2-like isoform X1 n=1 Tax=Clavelina lepadiformis TaxID=159417 RepID=UPI00404332F4
MAGAQVDADNELRNMVMCFRVSELQVLLGHAGRNKSGRKHELMTRALQLVRSSGCNKAIQAKVIDLYQQRYPHHGSAPHYPKNDMFSPPRRDAVNGKSHNLSPQRPMLSSTRHDPSYNTHVHFKQLPFYDNVSDIIGPVALRPRMNRMLQEETFKFVLNDDQYRKLKSSFKDRHNFQLQLRFCQLDTSQSQPDKLPQNLFVKINRSSANLPPFIPPTKSGVQPRRPNLPINISSLCRSSYDDFSIEVKWSTESGKSFNENSYAMTINLVQQLTVDDLLRKLKEPRVLPASHSRDFIREKLAKDPDSEIATTSLRVSLLCPLGKMRMKLPTRPSTCRHLQCFDASLFLMMNEKKPTWICPVCDRPAEFRKLVIDGMFVEILANSDSDEIEFTEDGKWHATKKNTETLVIGTPMKPIDLSQNRTKTQEEKKSKQPEVIDLTCDSSDDEDPAPVSLISSPPSVIPDGTPMSVSSSPGDVGSPRTQGNRLELPLSNYSSTSSRKSPVHHKKSTVSRRSPSRSPYSRNEGPYYLGLPPSRQTPPILNPSPRITPPLHQSSVSSQSSPIYPLNGITATPPLGTPPMHIPAMMSATSPGLVPPNLDMGINSFSHTQPLSFMGPLGDPIGFSQLDLFNARSYHDYFSRNPFLGFSQFPQNPVFDYNRTQRSAAANDVRIHNLSQRFQEEDLNFPSDGISSVD